MTMKKNKIIGLFFLLIILGGVFVIYHNLMPKEKVVKNNRTQPETVDWKPTIASVVNKSLILADVDTKQLKSTRHSIFMGDGLALMLPVESVRDVFDCAVNCYLDYVTIEKGSSFLNIYKGKSQYELNGEKFDALDSMLVERGNEIFISSAALCDAFGYEYSFDYTLNQARMKCLDAEARTIPYKYNYETIGKVSKVRDQGSLGTCWSIAALTALESTLRPRENWTFSVDHMAMNHAFNIGVESGGHYTMAMAYLLAWKGPVLETDDPYGDGKTNSELEAVKHVQEIQWIESKDLEKIKKMIFKYGGVQSSFYASVLGGSMESSRYYNVEHNSYCYIGSAKSNHDIVIIGWDDNYPKENFNMDIEGNGAFICRNSWGEDFGVNGNFYISYYDSNIGVHNTVYTKVEDTDNYDHIYQTDLCGYVGQLGYMDGTGYFANAYTMERNELIEAVGFYATGVDTEYSIYICENFQDSTSLSKRSDPIASGKFTNSGYYTVELEQPVLIEAGQKYAVIVRINTPNTERPIAVEFVSDSQTATVDLTDGEGYISYQGLTWENTEQGASNCNVCLKVYTSDAVVPNME